MTHPDTAPPAGRAAADAGWRFDNRFVRELPGAFVACTPQPVRAPRLLFLNDALAAELGLDPAVLQADPAGAAALFAGNALPPGAEPVAQAYAGHQFGGFSPQLGDGRAHLLGEIVDRAGRRRDVAFKGSGRTPFSRGGDGRAAVGPMLREVIVGEALHALGIPTTRALAVAATGESVRRETPLPGAVLTRVADSHLRVGTLQFFAARGDVDRLRAVADHAIARHDPALAGRPDRVLAFLEAVARRQAALVAQWLNVGFIHGVMNTDNMALSGQSIDFGPCAFMDAYHPATVFSSIDTQGRYAYANQPAIARWNLARLAEALLPLLAPDAGGGADGHDDAGGAAADPALQRAVDDVSAVIDAFPDWHDAALLAGRRAKLGLSRAGAAASAAADAAADGAMAADWLALLQARAADFTGAWRALAPAAAGDLQPLLQRLGGPGGDLDAWLARWQARCAAEDGAAGAGDGAQARHAAGLRRAAAIAACSPRIVPRNHQVEAALDAASQAGDLGPFQALLAAVRRPFDDDPSLAGFAEPAPAEASAGYRTFCGT